MPPKSDAPSVRGTAYPAANAARDRFILERRPARAAHDAWRYQGVSVEDELTAEGQVARTATVFLTGSECPWRCAMCDLWRYTTTSATPAGAISAQVAAACEAIRGEDAPVTQIKLYNAGSFFDPRAVPEVDHAAVARALAGFARVVVESHPALIDARVDRFLERLDAARAGDRPAPRLEVAMGLETVHPDALQKLNKRMTVEQFVGAASCLARRGVALRAFLLIAPPFVPADEQDAWLRASIDVAFTAGASVVTLIPTRDGNGAIEALSAQGAFRSPRLEDIEASVDAAYEWAGGRGRLFVDLWDLERFSECGDCFAARRNRLHAINLEQRVLPPIACTHTR